MKKKYVVILSAALCAAALVGVSGCAAQSAPPKETPAPPGNITTAGNERDGNLSFREREGCVCDGTVANEYMYNALRFSWN